MSDTIDAFMRASTAITPVLLVPELKLHLALDSQRIFQRAAELDRPGEKFQPFWAFAWPGGQALARYILDTPVIIRGRRVIDIGAGSGMAAIAAMHAGGLSALAADIDPLAVRAIQRNAAVNGVEVATTTADILGEPIDADLVLIADLVYEPELATRVAAFLEAAARAGTDVLLADRSTSQRPPLSFSLLREYDAPLTPDMHDLNIEKARLWRLDQRRGRKVRRR